MTFISSFRRPAVTGLAFTAVLAGLLSGCSTDTKAEAAPEQSETASASASATASPTPSPTETDPGRLVDASQLRAGDCFDDGADVVGQEDYLTELNVVPCEQTHQGEVYAVKKLPDGDFPADAELEPVAEEFCIAEFEPYVGQAFERSLLEATYLVPSEESWNFGNDRDIACVLTGPAGMDREGSAKNFA